MNSLLFAQLALAKQSIEDIENLVAIFTQLQGANLLFIYNTPSLPNLQERNVSAALLSDLPGIDLSNYDGLFIGFDVLEVLRSDLATRGPLFYPIERIYEERRCIDKLHHTMANLSIEIMKHSRRVEHLLSQEQRTANEVKALKVALPGILRERDCSGLVAVLPLGELNRFLARKTCHFLYLDEDDSPALQDPLLNTKDNWVIGFEELRWLSPKVDPRSPFFVDLRLVLQRMHGEEALQKTRKGLARLLYRAALADHSFFQPAWELASEYWLAQVECEDLVAFYPCNDFSEFLETGRAIRIYRVLRDHDDSRCACPGIDVSLYDFSLHELPAKYGETVFLLPGVQSFFTEPLARRKLDLCRVLFKAGRKQYLARSLWLLSRDILHGFLQLPDTNNLEAYQLCLEACLRSLLIYNLSNPWQWRQGRWELYLQEVYQTLGQILQNAPLVYQSSHLQVPLEDYYQALALWYSCSATGEVDQKLKEMWEKANNFLRKVKSEPEAATKLAQEIAYSHELVAVGESLLNRSSELLTSQEEPKDIPNGASSQIQSLLRKAADSSEPLPFISDIFTEAVKQLQVVRRERHFLYTQERDARQLIAKLEKLRADLEGTKRRLFMPLHEQQALVFAYEQESEAIMALLKEIESSAKINVTLKNAWVDLHRPVHVTLEVTNRGRVEAKTLEMMLNPSGGYKLLDPSPIREIMVLPPNVPEYVNYYILPERIGAELRVEYSFSDLSGQRHKDTWTSYLNVRSLDVKPFQVKVNRYQFGRPIQNIAEFYGRRSELQNILSLLRAGGKQNVLLRGPRRMGKTSLLYMLKTAIADREARRFFGIPQEWDEQLNQVHPVFLSLHSHDLTSSTDASAQFFRILLERVGWVLEVDQNALRQMEEEYCRRVHEVGAVNAALEKVGQILDAFPHQRIAVLLDEYDEVYRPGVGNLDRNLREFVSAEQRLTWIISSTLALFHEIKTISSPWFNVFMIIELGRLSEEAALELVEVPSRGQNIVWQSDAALSLLNETGRHPAFTQLFCGRVISYLNQAKTNYVLQETILSVADQIVDEQETANSHFEFFWQDTRGIGRLILLILDEANRPLRRDEIRYRVRQVLRSKFGSLPQRLVQEDDELIEWQDCEFKNQMDWVEKITNAISLNDQKQYFFTVPLFRRWLRRRRDYQDLEEDVLEKIAQEIKR